MAVRIDFSRCDGCRQAKESACVYICPGNLFYPAENNLVKIRDIRDCWDCAACVKICPKEALELYLPVQLGGKGATITARTRGKGISWECASPSGKKEKFKIQVKN
ncbi:MAG: adenylylsulfate reductase [Clostridia bacterium]|nr:adenylylsulfate reductase [Clostridia bacterium]